MFTCLSSELRLFYACTFSLSECDTVKILGYDELCKGLNIDWQ